MLDRVALLPVLFVAALAVSVGCGEAPLTSGSELRGSWGGNGFGLEARADSASAIFTCAYGTLQAPIAIDAGGRFAVRGEYVREVGPAALRSPARYTGRVTGTRIELAVIVTDTITDSGDYTLGPFAGALNRTPVVAYCQ